MARTDAFSTARELKVDGKSYRYYSLKHWARKATKELIAFRSRSKSCLRLPFANSMAGRLRKITSIKLQNGRMVKMKIRKFRSFHPASFFRTSPAFRLSSTWRLCVIR